MYRVLGYASHSANCEIIEMNNSSKRLGRGCDDLKVCTLRRKQYFENVQKRTKGRGGQKSLKLSVRTV